MRLKTIILQTVIIIFLLMLLSACTSSSEIIVTFDGKKCTMSGPSVLLIGEHSFILNDKSDKKVDLWIGRLLEGKTVQDLYDGQGEPSVWFPKPNWFYYTQQIGTEWINDNGGEVWTYSLKEEAEYVIYVGIYQKDKKNLWFCPQTLQTEIPSQ
ncbi:hypothetical protein ACFL5D_01955 [Candidatus Neomarinimicrobiota bacterium]